MYTITQISTILKADIISMGQKDAVIERLATDSRHLIFPNSSLFIALIGQRHDGHDFILGAYQQGVRSFIVSKSIDPAQFPKANILICPNGFDALQKLAGYHRNQYKIPVLAITGSNGKTIIKEWLYQLFSMKKSVFRSPKSFNSQVGVPLSLWQLKSTNDFAIIEAGISLPGEMIKLEAIIQPTLGLFTNIGSAHGSGFNSQFEKISEKLKLFKHTEKVFVCKDHDNIYNALKNTGHKHIVCWSSKTQADLRVIKLVHGSNFTQIDLQYQDEHMILKIPFIDRASIENILHCALIALDLGFNPHELNKSLQLLEPITMRLELLAGANQCQIINDIYNFDLESFQVALAYQQQQGKGKYKVLILSDLLESNFPKQDLYQKVGQLISQNTVNEVFSVGAASGEIKNHIPLNISHRHFGDTDSLMSFLKNKPFSNASILLKAARKFRFEKISHFLSSKSHDTSLEINMNAIGHNLRYFSNLCEPNVKQMVMLKAFGYGSGSPELARFLEYQTLDYIAVAYMDEGIELRKAGITSPILVLHPQSSQFEEMSNYSLEAEIFSFEILDSFIQFARNSDKIVPIHIKIDSGMRRLGFLPGQIPQLIEILKNQPQINVASIFSHLAAADDGREDDFTKEQVTIFQHCFKQICSALSIKPLKHILNTNGIVRFPQYQFDMVRLGIGLHGLSVSGISAARLELSMRLKAYVIQCKPVEKGDTVGYGRQGKINQPKRIAIVSIGYADGLSRLLGNGNFYFKIRNQRTPTIGNICMDMCMVDITDNHQVRAGDEVVIFETKKDVQKMAEIMQTIPYEIISQISQRVKRIYTQI